MRTIHTGFYSTKARKIIEGLLTLQKKDNNNHANTFARRCINKSTVDMDSSGEVVLACGKLNSWGAAAAWDGVSDSVALKKLGCFFKQRIMEALKKEGKYDAWDHKNELEVTLRIDPETTLTFSIKDAYYIYDMFLGRTPPASRYSMAFLNEIRGTQRDPITAEMINSLKEEITALEQSTNAEADRLQRESWTKVKAVKAEYEKRIKDLREETAHKIAELNASIEATIDGLANS